MRRLAPPLLIVALLAGSVMLLVVAAVPGLRHRHAGGVVHSHGDGHVHSHGGGHSHSHESAHTSTAGGREGWHVHITLFGFELTLWDAGSVDVSSQALADSATPRQRVDESPAGRPMLLSLTPATAGWMALFWIDAAPVPGRLGVTPDATVAARSPVTDDRGATQADAPPVPPPEAV